MDSNEKPESATAVASHVSSEFNISTAAEVFARFSMVVCANDGTISSLSVTCIWLTDGMTLGTTSSEGTEVSESLGDGEGGETGLTVLALAADEGEETAS